MDISIQNFETDLINASKEQPVLLDIWAPWCGPCKALGPVLEAVEVAYGGRFKLAKLNADEQPDISGQLSQMFGVRSIPFCVLFKDGQPVDGFVGALPEAKIREFLDKHVAPPEEVQEALQDLAPASPEEVLEALQAAVVTDPGNDQVRFDYVRALLTAGNVAMATQAFEPMASKVPFDANLAAVGLWLRACEQAPHHRSIDVLAQAIVANKRDFEARFELAKTHFAAQRFTQALDELLEIIQRDKTWNDEAARKNYVAILALMAKPTAPVAASAAVPAQGALELAGRVQVAPTDPLIDQYRRRLSMVLF